MCISQPPRASINNNINNDLLRILVHSRLLTSAIVRKKTWYRVWYHGTIGHQFISLFHTMPLTDLKIRSLKPEAKPRRYTDGGNLFIEVRPTGSKLWRYAYKFDGK